jgi:hypothetical protein
VFRAIEWRWWANGLRIGDVGVASDLGRDAILMIYLKFLFFAVCIGMVGATLVLMAIAGVSSDLMAPMGKLGKAARVSDVTLTVSEIGGAAGLVLIYLITFLAIGVVQRFYLQHELWRAVAQSLRLDNLASTANVVAEGVPVGALGEGLADSLDVAGF